MVTYSGRGRVITLRKVGPTGWVRRRRQLADCDRWFEEGARLTSVRLERLREGAFDGMLLDDMARDKWAE
jgi:hypothetical protein